KARPRGERNVGDGEIPQGLRHEIAAERRGKRKRTLGPLHPRGMRPSCFARSRDVGHAPCGLSLACIRAVPAAQSKGQRAARPSPPPAWPHLARRAARLAACVGGNAQARLCVMAVTAAGVSTMSYIEQSLGRNEELWYRAHFPWFYHGAAWGLLVAFLLGGVVAYESGYGWPGALLALLGVALFAAIMFPIWAT